MFNIDPTEPSADKLGLKKQFRQLPGNKQFRRLAAILGIVLCLGLYFFIFRATPVVPFPPNLASQLSYPVYFANGAPNDYNYKIASEKIEANILFYTMTNGKKNIFVTEQAKPATAIKLNSLPKHSPLPVSIGNAVVGTGLGNPSVVIITPTTLIQITSNKGVSNADVISVAQKMTQL